MKASPTGSRPRRAATGTVLRVVGAASADKAWDGVYEDVVEGWISFAQQLRFGLERHDIGPRRALYLGGSAKPGGTAPTAALGLAGLRDLPDGAPFSVDLPTGEHVEGQVWHRTPWQLGLTVPQWGDGLLIVTDKSATEEAPDGRGMAVLTVYGFSDEDFARAGIALADLVGRAFPDRPEAGLRISASGRAPCGRCARSSVARMRVRNRGWGGGSSARPSPILRSAQTGK